MSNQSTLPQAELARVREGLACIIIGVVAASILFGITVLQAYIYYRENVKEPTVVKFLVGLVCFFDTSATVFITIGAWIFFVQDFGNQADMPVVKGPPAEALVIGANVFTALITQLFFAYRLWIFSKQNIVLAGIVVVFALGSFAPGLWIASRFVEAASLFDIQTTKARIIGGLWNGLGAICDVFILLVLSCYLHTSRLRSKRSSDSVDEKLMQYMIECCGITALCQTCILVTFSALPGRVVFFPFLLIVGKLYSNTFLGTLNVRQKMTRATNTGRQDLGPDALATLGQLCNISVDPHSSQPTDAGIQTMSEVCIGSPSTGSEASDPWRKALVGEPDRHGAGVCVFSDVKQIV
ncbi:hypothetical protein GSI_08676 [Ganoderma sinense ZZ0214-1]|uniref:DUF6534 domain-containing protein n=1 Tax=Ganoderma sinense ZZ0214-1 TaxID=1077348 RepID=A0A2G8S4H7_9APHY|nr:hypothetical protein GSI_08676 [Ganoderma sinense ZZ0214-1]